MENGEKNKNNFKSWTFLVTHVTKKKIFFPQNLHPIKNVLHGIKKNFFFLIMDIFSDTCLILKKKFFFKSCILNFFSLSE